MPCSAMQLYSNFLQWNYGVSKSLGPSLGFALDAALAPALSRDVALALLLQRRGLYVIARGIRDQTYSTETRLLNTRTHKTANADSMHQRSNNRT